MPLAKLYQCYGALEVASIRTSSWLLRQLFSASCTGRVGVTCLLRLTELAGPVDMRRVCGQTHSTARSRYLIHTHCRVDAFERFRCNTFHGSLTLGHFTAFLSRRRAHSLTGRLNGRWLSAAKHHRRGSNRERLATRRHLAKSLAAHTLAGTPA